MNSLEIFRSILKICRPTLNNSEFPMTSRCSFRYFKIALAKPVGHKQLQLSFKCSIVLCTSGNKSAPKLLCCRTLHRRESVSGQNRKNEVTINTFMYIDTYIYTYPLST